MANRGNSHDPEVYGIKDLERLGSPKLDKSAKASQPSLQSPSLTSPPRLRESEAAYDHYKIRPPVLRDPTGLDASTTICGTKVTFPFGFSRSAMQALAHPDGEVGKSKAAATFGVPLGLSNDFTMTRGSHLPCQRKPLRHAN
ncbi:Alpha-hydroxy acid dehydrogenase, FMN-dependent [Ilyonectria robusta]